MCNKIANSAISNQITNDFNSKVFKNIKEDIKKTGEATEKPVLGEKVQNVPQNVKPEIINDNANIKNSQVANAKAAPVEITFDKKKNTNPEQILKKADELQKNFSSGKIDKSEAVAQLKKLVSGLGENVKNVSQEAASKLLEIADQFFKQAKGESPDLADNFKKFLDAGKSIEDALKNIANKITHQ